MLSRLPRTVYLRAAAPAGSSSTVPRLSASALGKRPAIPPRAGFIPGTITLDGARHFSWSPYKSPSSSSSSVDVPPPAPEPALGSPHPDLPAAPVRSATIESTSPSSSAAPPDVSSAVSSLPDAASTDPSLLPQSPALPSVPTLEELVTQSGKSLSEVLSSPEAVHATMKVSDLSLIGMEHGFLNISGWLRDALVSTHVLSGLPWWATIAATTVALRMCLLPLIVRMTKHNVRLAAVQPQMATLMKRLSEAKTAGDQQAQLITVQTLQKLMKENDVSPFRPLLMPLIQMPFFLGFFNALRKMAYLPVPQLKEGGFSWVTDLTLRDPYFILPTTSVLFTVLVLRVGADGTAPMNTNVNMGHLRNGFTVLSVLAIPFLGQMPAAVLFYWTFNNLFSLTQAFLLRQPAVKTLLRIPRPPPPAPLPPGVEPPKDPSFKDSWDALRKRIKDIKAQSDAQVAARLQQAERSRGLREGAAVLTERVREKGGPAVQEAMLEAAATPVEAPVQGQSHSPSIPAVAGLSKEDAKARRVAAARERRARH